jgi:hypothetical protein
MADDAKDSSDRHSRDLVRMKRVLDYARQNVKQGKKQQRKRKTART